MTVAWWVAHVLAVHLSVPEPVTMKMVPTLWPTDRLAQMAHASNGYGWEIQIVEGRWKQLDPNERAWLVTHELCHGAFGDWVYPTMSKKQVREMEARADKCASQVLRSHGEER